MYGCIYGFGEYRQRYKFGEYRQRYKFGEYSQRYKFGEYSQRYKFGEHIYIFFLNGRIRFEMKVCWEMDINQGQVM